jgi:hypothetical protein
MKGVMCLFMLLLLAGFELKEALLGRDFLRLSDGEGDCVSSSATYEVSSESP